MKNRPECDIPGCSIHAANAGRGRWRKAKWVREEYDVEHGWVCQRHHKEHYNILPWSHKFKKDYCENEKHGHLGIPCTSTIVSANSQLELDHINGDSANNMPENLQTLCSCCHSWKTYAHGDHLSPGRTAIKREKEENEEFME